MRYSVHLYVLFFSLSLFGCNNQNSSTPTAAPGTPGSSLERVTLALNWYPEAEHGGFYTAQLEGYFAEEGLKVEIIPGGPGAPVVPMVAGRTVDFAVGNADQVILGRAQQANVVALMTPLQKSPRCIMVHAESNITSFDQLENMTVAMNGGRSFAAYLQSQLPLTGVNIVPYNGNLIPFLEDKNFATQGYVFSEPFTAKEKGANPHTLMVYDMGFNPYTSLLMTSDSLKKENPVLVQKMTRACIKGWQKYLADPAATNTHLHKLNPELSDEMLEFGVEAIRPLCELPEAGELTFGQMTLKRWTTLIDQMIEAKVIEGDRVKAGECFLALPGE
ncbi:MAG: myristoyl transferase [Blastopirellula sp.]|nr:MAG: myristoyl transferase [Blastopirellula sp.]